MKQEGKSIEEIIQNAPEERREALTKLVEVTKNNLPKNFESGVGYGMISFHIPHNVYPKGYHCDPKLPLPFINIASQKNFIALYHMGLYADPTVLNWFQEEYKKRVPGKLDMGKSCIRFKKTSEIPYDLIGELATKFTAEQWIEKYESAFNKK